MAFIVLITKSDEDPDTVFYRYETLDGQRHGTVAVDRKTRRVAPIEGTEDPEESAVLPRVFAKVLKAAESGTFPDDLTWRS